jgi:hypothetical protein
MSDHGSRACRRALGDRFCVHDIHSLLGSNNNGVRLSRSNRGLPIPSLMTQPCQHNTQSPQLSSPLPVTQTNSFDRINYFNATNKLHQLYKQASKQNRNSTMCTVFKNHYLWCHCRKFSSILRCGRHPFCWNKVVWNELPAFCPKCKHY